MPADHKDINKFYTSLSTEIVDKFTLHVARKKLAPPLILDPLAMFIHHAEVFQGDS